MKLLGLLRLWPPFEKAGIEYGEPPDVPGIEFTAFGNPLHFTARQSPLHYTAPANPLHFEREEN